MLRNNLKYTEKITKKQRINYWASILKNYKKIFKRNLLRRAKETKKQRRPYYILKLDIADLKRLAKKTTYTNQCKEESNPRCY